MQLSPNDSTLNHRTLQFYDRDTAVRHHLQHREIVEAVCQRDGDQAERLFGEHFPGALAIIRAALDSRPPDAPGPERAP